MQTKKVQGKLWGTASRDWLPILLTTFVIACSKDTDVNMDIDSPAYHIRQSEKLVMPAQVELPDNLPTGNSRIATYFAEGVQKYKAQVKAGSDPVSYEWVFVAPLADLYDITNRKVGTHSAGPSWQLSGSADTIYAQQFSPPKAAPSPGPVSIDWLQLMPKNGKAPTGHFQQVSYIQRIATNGGKAPAKPPVSITDTVDVKYTAIYRFSKKN